MTPDYALTSRILSALKGEVALRGAKLVLVFIPSKREVENLDDSTPYQAAIAALCEQLALDYFDLAPALKKAYLRTYYLEGMHWTSHGHKLAAEALSDFLRQQLDVHADSPD